MKMFEKEKQTRLWGNHIDPEVSAESYLNSENSEVSQWAEENEQELQQLDRDTINLYRRHMANNDLRNTDTVLEKRKKKETTLRPGRGNLPKDPTDRWINNMFSRRPEDLFQLVSDERLANELKNLTPRQQEVVHMSIVKKMKNSEIAKRLGTTDRNVRDILQRTYEKMRAVLSDNRGEGYVDAVAVILLAILLPTFAIGWGISCWIYPKLKRAVTGMAA